MRGDSNDLNVFYGMGAVACILVMIFLLGIVLESWLVASIPFILFLLMLLLAYAVYKDWPIPFLKRR